jgi:uncharacterized membrane protein YdjX (TVP38/TMEM64 family)
MPGFCLLFILFPLFSACGASVAFMMSRHFASQYVKRWFPHQILTLEQKVATERESGSLFFFLLFLRLFPASPNWLLNIVSPLAAVPLVYFFATVAFGLVPYNFLCVQTGSLLGDLRSIEDVFTSQMMMRLCGVSAVALGLAMVKKKAKKV